MTSPATVHLGVGVDTRDYRAFARALRTAAPDIAAQLKLRLAVVGSVVADEAEARASEASTSVPPSIKVRVSGATTIVQAGGAGIPTAGLLELGNKGKGGGDEFTHPVFGNRAVWVKQAMHPYLGPAVLAKADDVEEAALAALDATIDEVVRL